MTEDAFAQDRTRNAPIFQRSVAAPTRAFELGLTLGYDQGVGALDGASAPHVQDVASVGAGGEASAGYRVSPRVYVGAFGSGAFYTSVQPDGSAKSMAAGIKAAWHFRPYRSLDPWVTLGTGYRVFLDAPAGQDATVRKALEAVRVGVGVDYRLSPNFAIGPFVAGDLSFFFRESAPGQPSRSTGGALSTFVSAGISARFDLLGKAVHPAIVVTRR